MIMIIQRWMLFGDKDEREREEEDGRICESGEVDSCVSGVTVSALSLLLNQFLEGESVEGRSKWTKKREGGGGGGGEGTESSRAAELRQSLEGVYGVGTWRW